MTYPASKYTFTQHTVEYPPPGDGWCLAFVVATASGGSQPYDPYRDRGGHPTVSIGSHVVGIWTRERTEEDKERENRKFWCGFDWHSDEYVALMPEWIREKPERMR